MSTPKQRQLIGYFRKILKMPESDYRELIKVYHSSTSKELTYENASKVIEYLRNKAIALKIYVPKNNYLKFENLSGRWGYATPRQLRMISAMWDKVSNKNTKEERERALNFFVKRICGVEHINFCTWRDISKLKKAIENMPLVKERVNANN